MGFYEGMREWYRLVDMMANRAACCSQALGDRYPRCGGASVRVIEDSGRLRVMFLGRILSDIRIYDISGARKAYDILDGAEMAVWECGRNGLLAVD